MTSNVFFWYVLPNLISLICFGWIAYDYFIVRRRREREEEHPHPGE